jgi:hypothetical protein
VRGDPDADPFVDPVGPAQVGDPQDERQHHQSRDNDAIAPEQQAGETRGRRDI